MFIPRLVIGPEAQAFAPWCPEPDAMTRKRVQAAVDERHRQLGVDCLPLLHLDWRDYTHPAYLDALEHLAGLRERGEIAHLGVANFDTDHLRLLLRHSVPIAANQVSFSLLDRRAAGRMSELCLSGGVKPPARGALAGGLLGERWLDQPDPTDVAAVSLVIRERFGPTQPCPRPWRWTHARWRSKSPRSGAWPGLRNQFTRRGHHPRHSPAPLRPRTGRSACRGRGTCRGAPRGS